MKGDRPLKDYMQELWDRSSFEDVEVVEALVHFLKDLEIDLLETFVFKYNGRTFKLHPPRKDK